MSEQTRCDCGKVVNILDSGVTANHQSNGKHCSHSGKYANSILGKKRSTPYLHPEPKLVGESAAQHSPLKNKCLAKFRKTNWDSFSCAGCGVLVWIKAEKLAGILRGGNFKLESMTCWDCRVEGKADIQKGKDELLQARKNLALRKLAMKGR
jgi:hypothetical protein